MNQEDALYPCSFVIFGATGHLVATKLLPALYRLESAKRLPEVTNFVAFARREWNDADWTSHMEQALRSKIGAQFTQDCFARFAARFSYVRGDLQDVEAYRRLLEELGKPKTGVCSNIAFYLAVKPDDFGTIVSNLAAVGLNRPRGLHRIVVEKPFGEDIGSAQQLNQLLHSHFDEQQIYRIDHYLAKQSVQNLLVFRFANLMMEPPAALEADALRDEKVKVLRSVRPISPDTVHAHAVRAQYGPGNVEGRQVSGYLAACRT